ncbi:anthranilate synthase family protein [Amycolatopsis sp. cmx-11-12]|uniref:anthranilate synthase family protein n=1 Tax=Amycolatopsis sp. cmx-11-12 TaxID=2785795 RepID=UPI003917BA43
MSGFADLANLVHEDPRSVLAVVPYNVIGEFGHPCHRDDARLLALRIAHRECLPLATAVEGLPATSGRLTDVRFAQDDDEYAKTIADVVRAEVGTGQGSNFVVKRSLTARIADFRVARALGIFRRLLTGERGTYWTFLVHTAESTLVGATPERQISARDGVVTMNPISGTYRHPPDGPDLAGLLSFLDDSKETDELFMVVDEELKMMSRICEQGASVQGPFLKEMRKLAHTEFLLRGRTTLPLPEVLRRSLFAPTVTGSPLASAFDAITRHEKTGRRYYSGALALFDRDAAAAPLLDSCIMIRTAEISRRGDVEIGVGATIVRGSLPRSEVAETRSKVAGLLAALDGGQEPPQKDRPLPTSAMAGDPGVRTALRRRRRRLSSFWLAEPAARSTARDSLPTPRVCLVDAEDSFTDMMGHQLTALGFDIEITRWSDPRAKTGTDLVIVGPGPGDPRDVGDTRIGSIHQLTRSLLVGDLPFISVCLGHQVLCTQLGLPVLRKENPNQGVQKDVTFFGRPLEMGFYNTFVAIDDGRRTAAGYRFQVSSEPSTGEVNGLLGPHWGSFQFHPESVLSKDGHEFLGRFVRLIAGKAPGPARTGRSSATKLSRSTP